MGALRRNLQALKNLLAPEVALLPIIKSDAYGHGLLPVARVLAEEGVYGFGLSEVSEALRLREAGLDLPIILISGFERHWLPEIIHHRFIPVITDLWQLEALASYTTSRGSPCVLHLKVNTGMNRFGLQEEEFERALRLLLKYPQLRLEGLMSHLCCSERPKDPITKEQLVRFEYFRTRLKREGFRPKFFHLANSGGIIFLPQARYNMVRPGIALFGAYPAPEGEKKIKLFPVMTFYSRILSIKKIKAGEYLGYGPLFKAQRPMKIALVPVGYEDGYLRALSNKGFAVVRGQRVPVIGAVSMKCLFLDVTSMEDLSLGEKIILLGGPRREVPAEELAERAGTISYELFCLIGQRALRIYKE